MPTSYDAIVVGAGLGGLSAAAHLAATGHRTVLLERYAALGGSSHVFRRKQMWEFDCGVHYIGDCGPGGQVPTLLRGLGVDDRVSFLPLDRDGFDTIVAPDFELRVPVGWDAFEEQVLSAFPRERRAVGRWLKIMRRIGSNVDRSTSLSSRRGMAKFVAACGPAAPWILAPHAALMVACGMSPRTILALGVQSGAMATTPQSAPVALHAGFLNNFVGDGAWYPRGGGQMLAAAFLDVIRGHGGEVRNHADVERILVESGRVTGVRLAGGETLNAGAVVAAGDIKRTYRELVGLEHLPRRTARRVDRWKMSAPLINAFFGVELDAASFPNSNIFAIPNWESAGSLMGLQQMSKRMMGKSRDPLAWAKDMAANQPTFVQCSTRRDLDHARSAPPGHAAIEAQTLTPSAPHMWGLTQEEIDSGAYRKNKRYREIKEIVTEGLLDRVEQAHPGARANVRWSELGSPATQERYTHTTNGSSFGLEPRVSQFGPFRPHTGTAIDGLFLAGTSTVWGPGTEGAMLSGLYAASAISGRDLQTEVRAGAVLGDPSSLPQRPDDFDPLAASKLRTSGTPRAEEDEDLGAAPLVAS